MMPISTVSKTKVNLIKVIVLALLTSVATSAAGSSRQLMTSALAQVDSHVITLREVRMNALVDGALYGEPSSPQDHSTQVQGVLVEWSVFLEAESFSFSTVPRREVEQGIAKAKEELQSKKRWQALGATPDELEAMVRRKLVAKSFLDFKSTSSRVPVSDQEALAYYQKNQAKFGTLPFESFKDSIVRYLVQSHLETRLREWLELLHSKYNVKFFAPSVATRPGEPREN